MEVKTSDVIIPFHLQYLPKYVSLISQGGGSQSGGSWWPETYPFPLLLTNLSGDSSDVIKLNEIDIH